VAFVEDFAPFFADFGVNVTLGSATFKGIFDADHIAALGGVIDGQQPQVVCRSSDVAAAAFGGAITVNATSYTVRGIAPDGTGLTLLTLEV
jgi:hypothetical protein